MIAGCAVAARGIECDAIARFYLDNVGLGSATGHCLVRPMVDPGSGAGLYRREAIGKSGAGDAGMTGVAGRQRTATVMRREGMRTFDIREVCCRSSSSWRWACT